MIPATDFPRIDLDSALEWSPAAVALTLQKPDLERAVAEQKEAAVKTAAGAASKDELRAMLRELTPSDAFIPATFSRTDHEARYVKAAMARCDAAAKLTELEKDAAMERFFAGAINEMLDLADGADGEIRKITEKASGYGMARSLVDNLDSLMLDQFLQVHARAVAWAVMREGKTIREAADAEHTKALRTLVDLTDHVYSNGLGSVYRSRQALEAKAARLFLREVAKFLRTDEYRTFS
ncbi:hypothetical protein ACIHFD_49840 [Nonomuraea sp. NPDC051941]|uniref:hypothetical protein n=1 Tax=Nonomuraea sp. NPDC051941 TaxID=3364373 RepID=UPI0037C8A3BF